MALSASIGELCARIPAAPFRRVEKCWVAFNSNRRATAQAGVNLFLQLHQATWLLCQNFPAGKAMPTQIAALLKYPRVDAGLSWCPKMIAVSISKRLVASLRYGSHAAIACPAELAGLQPRISL